MRIVCNFYGQWIDCRSASHTSPQWNIPENEATSLFSGVHVLVTISVVSALIAETQFFGCITV